MKNLTLKQERFAQAYIRLGDKSAAYREAYSCENMRPETIHSKACILSENGKVRARIEELQNIAKSISETEFKHTITDSLKLDFELINRYKKHMDVLENPTSTTKQVNIAKRAMAFIKVQGFNAAMDRVSKKLGFYEKNNEQNQPIVNVGEGFTPDMEKRLKYLLEKANRSLKQKND
jgi:phage terminase small subunit